MPKLFLAYLLTFLVFLAIDMLWLGFIARDLYRRELGAFLSDTVNWTAAIVFYLIFIAGIFYFVLIPAVEKDSLQLALLSGALLGGLTYATYDLTNMATLKDWPLKIVIIDIAWGMVLTLLVSGAGFFIIKWLKA